LMTLEGVYPTSVGRWVDRSCLQAKAADVAQGIANLQCCITSKIA